MSEKEPQPIFPEKEIADKKLGDRELRKIIKFMSDEIWPLVDDEKNGFPKRKDESSSEHEKRVSDARDKLRHARGILVDIFTIFPHLKPDREQQYDMGIMGIYDSLKEDAK